MTELVNLTRFGCNNTTSESLKARKVFIFQHISLNELLKFHGHLSRALTKVL